MARILQYIEWVMFCAEASCEIRLVTEAEEECLVEISSIKLMMKTWVQYHHTLGNCND